jgi:hypothetical protein
MEFEEKQQLRLWWLYVLFGIETIITLSLLFLGKNGMSFHELKDMYFLPIIGVLSPYVLVYFVNKSTLSLKIDQCGITYRFSPFARQKNISWTQVDKLYTRKYDAFGEYGGWGMRYKLWFKRNDKAYIFNDKSIGLQLELGHCKRILFSTAKADELSLFLINFKRQYNIGAIETDVRER